MELFAFFAFVVVVFFVFSGPIALIWCSVLSSRLNELRQEREQLEYLLKKQQEKEWQNVQIRVPSRPEKSSTKEPETLVSGSKLPPEPTSPQNVLAAMQIAKEQAAEQMKPEESPTVVKPTAEEKTPPIQPAPATSIFAPSVELPSQKTKTEKPVAEIAAPKPTPAPTIAAVAKSEPTPAAPTPPPPPSGIKPSAVEKITPPPVPGDYAGVPTTSPALYTTPKPEEPKSPHLPPPTPHRRPLDDAEFEKAHPAASKGSDIAWQSVELWIGRKLLGWVAVAAFIVSAALFIIHAVNEGWIGKIPPTFRVLGIAAFGGVFLAAGKYFHRIGWRRFSTMLSSAGVIIVFQAGYASFAYFELISIQTASVVMSLVVLGSFLLSWHYVSTLLAMISIVGGLAVPMLLSSGTDRYPEFFTYLVILNLGSVMLVNLLRRPPIGILAFAGTQAEFWLWFSQYYVEPVEPAKLTAVLLFQGAFYAVWLLDTTIAAMVPKKMLDLGASLTNFLTPDPHEKDDVTKTPPKPKIVLPTWDDVVRAVLAPVLFFGTVWWVLRTDPVMAPWLGIFAFIGAAWYALLAVLYSRHLGRIRAPSAYWRAGPAAATVMSLAFLAVAIPLHFDAEWLALGWTTVFAGLWYFGHRQRNRTFLVLSVGFMAAGAIRLLYDIFVPGFVPAAQGTLTKSPEFGVYDLPSLAAVFVALISAVLVDRLLKAQDREAERNRNFWVGLSGYGFLTLFLSVEAIRFFLFRPEHFALAPHWASFSLTVLWSVLALLLLETGVTFRSMTLRYTALSALGLVTVKMILFDFNSRLQFAEPIHNPFCPALVGCSLLLIAAAVQARYSSRFDEAEKTGWGSLGIAGIFTLLGILSVECYEYYVHNPVPFPVPIENTDFRDKKIIAGGMLSVLWSVYASILLVVGLSFKNKAVRICGLVVLVGSVIKIVAMDLFRRPDYAVAVWNPYFLTILCPALVLMVYAVWTTWLRPLEDETERNCTRSLGIVGLFLFIVISSVECFFHFRMHVPAYVPEGNTVIFAVSTLSVLWAVFGTILMTLGLSFRSFSLRSCAAVVFMAALTKFAALEMVRRPDYATALLNPYFLTVFCPIIAVLAFACWTTRLKPLESESERNAYLALGLFGLLTLWIVLSVECFAYFFENPFLCAAETNFQRRLVAQASLSVLWTVLASIFFVLGRIQKSVVLQGCAMLVLTVAMINPMTGGYGFDYGTTVFNPFFMTSVWPMLAAMLFAVWTTRIKPGENKISFFSLGMLGILFLWAIVSHECYSHFARSTSALGDQTISTVRFMGYASLSILWAIIAAALIVIGIGWRSAYLRGFGLLVFFVTTLKIVVSDMLERPAFETALLNPYFIPIAVAAVVMIAAAVWTTKYRPLENERERTGYLAFGVIGILLLWGSLSTECFEYFNIRTDWPDHRFLALASLTVFWTVLAVLLAAVAVGTGSRALRILAVVLIGLAFVKVLPYELWERPGYLTPFLNPYAAPIGLLAFAMIFVCVLLISKIGETDASDLKTEKAIYRYIAFTGVALLWTVMSLECFKAVRILQDAASEAWKAQMALSILWSVFAGVLIFTGFVWRSAVLRWMAILLFAVTLTKVMIVDMAGVDHVYRFGAVFVLAVFLSLAAWAYQRFRPERMEP